jgi:hypothetical protein
MQAFLLRSLSSHIEPCGGSHPPYINTKTAEQKLNGFCGDPRHVVRERRAQGESKIDSALNENKTNRVVFSVCLINMGVSAISLSTRCLTEYS